MPFKPPEQFKCPRCSKSVYPMDEVVYQNQKYHQNCIRCASCNKNLGVTEIINQRGNFFCKWCVNEAQYKAIVEREPPVNLAPQGVYKQ